MRLILHIGTETPAPTPLQHFISDTRAALAARGVGLSDVAGSPNNRRLAAYCQPDGRIDNFFRGRKIATPEDKAAFFAGFAEDLTAELSGLGTGTVILTSEHFHSRLIDRDSVQKLHDLLAPLFSEIRVLCWFREQAAVARSLYSTAIKGGKTVGFDEFLDGCTPDSHRYNYHDSFRLWADVFGADALVARLFDRAAFVGGDIVTDFLAAAGIDPEGLAMPAGQHNESLGAVGLMLGRANNRINPRYLEDGSPNPVRRAVAQALERTALAQAGALDFAAAEAVHARFDSSNRAFARAFLGREDNPFAAPKSGGAAPVAIAPADLETFWETLLGDLAALPVLAPTVVGTLRRIARAIEAGATLGRDEAKVLKQIARQIRPSGGLSSGASPETDPAEPNLDD